MAFAAQFTQLGDTIRMAAGEYSEPETVLLNGGITLIGAGADSTELRNYGLPTVQIRTDSGNLTIVGIRFKSQPRSPYPVAILYSAPTDTLNVSRCIFRHYEVPISTIHAYAGVSRCEFVECAADDGDVIHLGTGNGFVENCVFTNSRESYFSAKGIAIEFVLEDGHYVIRNNTFRGYQKDVSAMLSLDTVIVENNLFLNNFLPPPNQIPPWALDAPYVSLVTPYSIVRNNFFEGCFEGETGENGAKPACVALNWYQYAEISNNIFVGRQPGVSVNDDNHVYANQPYGFEISYNDFWLEPRYWPISMSGGIRIQCEDYRRETDSSLALVRSNLCRDPMFVDTIDYLLQLYSPCIDAGRPDILDVDGSRSDIGPFGGSAGGFYIYQDQPPQMVQGLALSGTPHSSRLVWLDNSESDLSHYVIFRDTDSPPTLDSQHALSYVTLNGRPYGCTADAADKRPLSGGLLPEINSHLISNRQSLHYIDMVDESSDSFAYAVVAVDSSGLVSEPALIGQGRGAKKPEQIEGPLPEDFDLEQNYPNPFNAVTAIVYNLPNIGAQPAAVELVIYNSLGQEVRALVNQSQFPGRQVAYWDGKDDRGSVVASGVYFCSLGVSGITILRSRKLVLMK